MQILIKNSDVVVFEDIRQGKAAKRLAEAGLWGNFIVTVQIFLR